jgi:uncharacterized membrane protein
MSILDRWYIRLELSCMFSFLVTNLIFVGVDYGDLPETIPTHVDAAGNINK